METSLAVQLQQCFLSCGLGFLLGLYYDVFRIARVIVPPSHRALFLQDIFFFASSAVITFLFSLAVMEGRLRLYLFLGEAAGFFAYYFTLGRVVTGLAVRAVAAVLRAWKVLWTILLWPLRALWRVTRSPREAAEAVCLKTGQKALLFFKKGLQRLRDVVYNKKRKQPLASPVETEGNRSGYERG